MPAAVMWRALFLWQRGRQKKSSPKREGGCRKETNNLELKGSLL